MKTTLRSRPFSARRLLQALTALLTFALPGRAQSTAAPANAAEAQNLAKYDRNQNGRLDPDELAAQQADQTKTLKVAETMVMSPFEVRTDKDTSYGALNSNSISLFNMELLKTPVAAKCLAPMPVRSRIHSSDVSTPLAANSATRSALLSRRGGK